MAGVNGSGLATMAPGAVQRADAFGAQELAVSSEVQAGALAAQAEAEVKARWAIAQRCPRNYDSVRLALLRECERPGFADGAKYAKPVGGKSIIGPSIRFVETALRCMGNVIASATVISEDRQTRRLQVMVTDLETNVSWPRQITLEKTVERSNAEGRTVVSERLNSYGKKTYVVLATEDELTNKEGSAISKALRTAGLRVVPGDLVEEAMAKVDEVRNAAVKRDPARERKRIVDAFAAVGVTPEQLAEYLGHGLDFCQPAEVSELRDLHQAIRDGETRWAAVMEAKRELGATDAPAAPQATEAPTAPVVAPVAVPPPAASPPRAEAPPQAGPASVEALLALIESATTGQDLTKRIGPALLKAPEDVRKQVMAAYQAKAGALRGGGR